MEKQALLGGPTAQPRPTQRQRATSKNALFIAVVTLWALASWHFFIPYRNPWPHSAEPGMREYAGESIEWRLCGDITGHDLECGTVDVPMDQFNATNSRNKTFQIPLVRMRGRNATNNLLVNPGGPGASGISYVYGAGEKLSKLIGEDFHIIGFDPRGVNSSTPEATCYVDAESRERLRPRRSTDLIRDSPYLYAWSTNYVRACQENSGEHFKYINTPQTAADMNSIIDALGQKHMYYWGISYGSLLGQVYATLFPERSERIVIDGVTDQAYWFEELMETQRYDDTGAVVDGFFEECVLAGDACALSKFGKTGPELRENVTSVINSLYKSPASVYINGTVYGTVDDFDLRIRSLFQEMYSPAHWPALAQRLADLQEGNATGVFLSYVKDNALDNVPEANLAVQMNDGQSGPAFWPQGRMPLMEKLLPYFDKYRFALGDMMDFHVKQKWTTPKTHTYRPKTKVETTSPLLILSTTYDPVSPYAAAQSAQKTFVGSRLVALDAYGHASIAMPSLCMAKHVRAYFENGALPEENVVCKPDGAYFPNGEEVADHPYPLEQQELLTPQSALADMHRAFL
ncbi:Alpha/beta hydrolase fold-1 [Akanthomyces lecanii RCEF 1005]|uniref:Alpha/beta hydrolase fold-1 n=1 Tax=Akanthomyces lecanii RCEF 1005 TaxID=1081108 RepID=A0A162MUQ0_CORDF|nr:Alpha/beta hydrolase fold-1 [Akanthomyces lecanii RCEF 1005]